MKRILSMICVYMTMLAVPLMMQPTTVFAACAPDSSAKGQVQKGLGETGSNCSSSGVNDTVNAVVQILSLIAGIAAVIMVLLSGIKYTTSGGDTNKVASAKNTLIYALIGIAVAVVAQVLVHFVINTTSNATTPCPGKPQYSKSDPKC